MKSQIAATAISLSLYLLISLSYYGWGQVFVRLLRGKKPSVPSEITLVWLGWAFTLFIFQVLHFWFAITAYLVVPVLAVSIVFSARQIASMFQRCWRDWLASKKIWIIALFFLLFAVWAASRSMLHPENYDSGMYHVTTIRWTNAYPIVPGLGNLHGRLAFNQSFFTYAAALNFYPFFGNGRSIANSFLLLLTCGTVLSYLKPVFKSPSTLLRSHPFLYFPGLFALPFLAYLAMTSNGLASPTPDLASTLLQLFMFVLLTHGIGERLNGQHDQKYTAILLVILASTSITIKLSNVVFAGVMIVFVLLDTWTVSRRMREVFFLLLPAAVLIAVWCLRGIVLSGVPFFPSPFGYVSVDWAVPKEDMAIMSNWIYSFARMPNTPYEQVLGNWNWLKPWLKQIITEITDFVFPAALSAALFGMMLVLSRLKKIKLPGFSEWSIMIPFIFSIIFWFFTAPDLRFANGLFHLLAVSMIILTLSSIQKAAARRRYLFIVCAALVLGNIHYAAYAVAHWKTIKDISRSGYQTIVIEELSTNVTQSGLVVTTPKTGFKCWDAPLPCSTHFDPTLALRKPGDLGGGFFINRDLR